MITEQQKKDALEKARSLKALCTAVGPKCYGCPFQEGMRCRLRMSFPLDWRVEEEDYDE